MVRWSRHRLMFLLTLLLFPVLSSAQAPSCTCPPTASRCICVGVGTELTIPMIAQNVIHFLTISISTVASVMFLVGAFMIVLSGAKEDYKQKGKDLMIGSLLSLGVVLGAYAIYQTVIYFLLEA